MYSIQFNWPLSPAASRVSWYWSCLVCSGLAYEICSGGGPSTCIYCVVCHVIVAPYVRSVCHIFDYLYSLDDDSECPMDHETSLLPKVLTTLEFMGMWKKLLEKLTTLAITTSSRWLYSGRQSVIVLTGKQRVIENRKRMENKRQ